MSDIIHLISSGHSGSTLLDISIGSHKNFFSTGECTYFTWQLIRADSDIFNKKNGNVCTCLSKLDECSFWQKVITEIKNRKGINEITEKTFPIIVFGEEKYSKTKPLFKRIEKLLFKSLVKYNLKSFALLTSLWERRKIKNLSILYDSISISSGAKYIIDSSKDIFRYWLLKKIDKKNNHHVVLLVRNPKGIAFSDIRRYKDKAKPIAKVYGWCRKYNLTTSILKSLNVNPHILVYEEFCRNPEKELNKIYDHLKQPNIKKLSINTSELHLVAGNPIRYNDEIHIRVDEEWKTKLSPEINDTIDGILETRLKSGLIKNIYNIS